VAELEVVAYRLLMANTGGTQFVAFLRGINVGANGKGRKNVPMPELRALAEEIGFAEPQTHLQSGNLLFEAKVQVKTAEERLEAAILERFGFEVTVMVRTMKELVRARKGCPFEDAVLARPKLVHIGFAKEKLARGALELLEPYAKNGELIAFLGQSFWIDYPSVGGSKLTPAVLNRVLGSPVTQRNAKTLDAIVAMSR